MTVPPTLFNINTVMGANTPHYVSALDVEEWATKCINLERERDEAREDLEFLRGLYKVLDAANSHLMTVNEEAVKLARTLKQERNQAMDVLSNLSHYLSCGLGDDKTTAQEYGARIREGINSLTDPIVKEKEKLRKMLDLQTKIVVDLEMRLMK